MQTSKITAFIAVSALALGLCAPFANAQPQPPQHGQGPQHEPAPQQRSAPQQRDARQPAQAPRNVARKPAPQAPQNHARGAGPEQQWHQGGKLPQQYRSNQYVVNDWQHHGLKKPGRGQQWVQYGGDYMLVAVASGVIAQMILGH